MSLEKTFRGIIIPIAAACSLGLAALSLNPAINPTVSEIVAERKLKDDYNLALENYSEENKDNKDFSGLSLQRGEIGGRINGRYVAFSLDKPLVRYLDDKTLVSDDDLFNFIKAYSQR
jgi:hypothetical protein